MIRQIFFSIYFSLNCYKLHGCIQQHDVFTIKPQHVTIESGQSGVFLCQVNTKIANVSYVWSYRIPGTNEAIIGDENNPYNFQLRNGGRELFFPEAKQVLNGSLITCTIQTTSTNSRSDQICSNSAISPSASAYLMITGGTPTTYITLSSVPKLFIIILLPGALLLVIFAVVCVTILLLCLKKCGRRQPTIISTDIPIYESPEDLPIYRSPNRNDETLVMTTSNAYNFKSTWINEPFAMTSCNAYDL